MAESIRKAALAAVKLIKDTNGQENPAVPKILRFTKHDLCMALFTMQSLSMTDVYAGCAPILDGDLYRDGDGLCCPEVDAIWPTEPENGMLEGGEDAGVSRELHDKLAIALFFQNSWASPNHKKLLARIMERTGLLKSGPLPARKLGRQEYTAFAQSIWHNDEWVLDHIRPYYKNPFPAGTVEAGLFTMARDHWDAFSLARPHKHYVNDYACDLALLILQKSAQYGLQGQVNIRALQYMAFQVVHLLEKQGEVDHREHRDVYGRLRRFPYGPGFQKIHDIWGKWGKDPIPSSAFSFTHIKTLSEEKYIGDSALDRTLGAEEVTEPRITDPLTYYCACLVVARAANPNMKPVWNRLPIRALFRDYCMNYEEGKTPLRRDASGAYALVKVNYGSRYDDLPLKPLLYAQQTILPNGKENIITGHPCDLAYAGLGHPNDRLATWRNEAYLEYLDGFERDSDDCFNDIFVDSDTIEEAYQLYGEYIRQRKDIDTWWREESHNLKGDDPDEWRRYWGSDDFEKFWSMYHSEYQYPEDDEEDDTPLPPPEPDTEKDWDEGICGPDMADQDALLMEEFERDHGEES